MPRCWQRPSAKLYAKTVRFPGLSRRRGRSPEIPSSRCQERFRSIRPPSILPKLLSMVSRPAVRCPFAPRPDRPPRRKSLLRCSDGQEDLNLTEVLQSVSSSSTGRYERFYEGHSPISSASPTGGIGQSFVQRPTHPLIGIWIGCAEAEKNSISFGSLNPRGV